MVCSVAITHIIKRIKFAGAVLIPVLLTPCFFIYPKKFNYDEDMRYTNYLSVQQDATYYLLHQIKPGDSIYANFPVIYGIEDHRLGFMHQPYDSSYYIIKSLKPQKFNYAVIAEPGADDHRLPAQDSLNFRKLFENHTAKISIYTLNQKE
jgi:hypothetical protein